MDKPFTGFSSDRLKTVRVPEGFFEDVLPQIGSMLEMKLTLYLFWRLARGGRNGSSPRMVSLEELDGDAGLRAALARSKGPRPVEEAIREGLELAVARGTILQLGVRGEGLGVRDTTGTQTLTPNPSPLIPTSEAIWYVLNTRENREWIDALANGRIDVGQTPLVGEAVAGAASPRSEGSNGASPTLIRVIAERPSVYALYEQNIGLLTPILAERLQDAEGRYPMEWIAAAFEEAVTNNKRSWRYIERILERWAAEGKDSGKDRGPAGRGLDPDKYTKGKYAFLFRPDK